MFFYIICILCVCMCVYAYKIENFVFVLKMAFSLYIQILFRVFFCPFSYTRAIQASKERKKLLLKFFCFAGLTGLVNCWANRITYAVPW